MHAVAPCEACHLSAVFRDAGIACNECHARDDEHEQKLGSQCEHCHNPNAWSLWEFDHDRQTEFRLDGSHEGLACNACHTRPVTDRISQSASCSACHRDDDIHEGRFGRVCERCHNSDAFNVLEIR
jgi:hypothetical protein